MKKQTTFLTLLLIAMICLAGLTSCNSDATDGIYSLIEQSTESSNINIMKYLGYRNDAYYYLSRTAVEKSGSGPVIQSSDTIFAAAFNENSGAFLVLTRDKANKTTLRYYTSETDTNPEVIGSLNKYKDLLTNGLFYSDNAVYYYDGSAVQPVIPDAKVIDYLVSEDYAFFNVKEGSTEKSYIVKNDGTKQEVTHSDAVYKGFQVVSGSPDTFYLFTYNSDSLDLYKVSGSEPAEKILSSNSSISSSDSNGPFPSFAYSDGVNNYIVVKATSFFDRINITNTSLKPETLSGGFATNVRTANVVNILPVPLTSNEFVAGTFSSGLYKMDVDNDKSEQL